MGGVDLSHCPDNRCLIKALKHFYGRLVNNPIEGTTIDWGAAKLTDADALKYLINLIGDLHQPMHLGFDDDNMGQNITVEFRGKQVSLYDFWDKELAQAVIHDSPGFWWGGWTHVQRTRSEYEKDAARWKEDGVKMFDEWAEESVKFACGDIYKNPVTGKRIGEDGGVFRIDMNLFETWKREMLSKILVAGARTAIVVNSILAQREAGALHAGSGVTELEGEEDDTAKAQAIARRNGHKHDPGHKHVEGFSALVANAAIFTTVFVVFTYTQRQWQGHAQVDAARAEKSRGGDNAGKAT